MKMRPMEKLPMYRVLFVVACLRATIIFGPTEAAENDDEYKKCTQHVCSGKQACVTIYEDENHGGWYQCKTFEPDECITLNSWWTKHGSRVSGVDTLGTCVRLYGETNCQGEYIEIQANTESSKKLKDMSFDDKTMSISSCKRALCPTCTEKTHSRKKADDVYEKCTAKDCSGVAACVTLYQHKNFGGWAQCQTLQQAECITLNSWWIKDGSRVSSVDNHGNCVRLYDQVSCGGAFIELTAKHASQKRLEDKDFDDRTKSVSACKRTKNITSEVTKFYGHAALEFEKCTTNDCSGKEACVTIYQHENHGGWYQCHTFHDEECITLAYWWRNEVSGVDSHGTCIRLYEGRDCGGTYVEIRANHPSQKKLKEINFDDATRSVSSCKGTRNGTHELKDFYAEDKYEKCTTNDCSGKGACATIYEHADFTGWNQCFTFKEDECLTLNSWWLGSLFSRPRARVSSVDTHSTCVRLYDGERCTGTYIDVTPNHPSQKSLKDISNFDDYTKSISSCNRTHSTDCKVKVLFSKFIESNMVSDSTEEILEKLEPLAEAALSGFAIVIPGLDIVYGALKAIIGLFNTVKSTEALIDAKIEAAFSKYSASQLGAKMDTIYNRLQDLLSPKTPNEVRNGDLGVAIDKCEEVHKLFEDQNYSFSSNKVVSSPYLVAFSTVYLSIAKLALGMRPDLKERMTSHISKLTELNELYRDEAITQRKEKLKAEKIFVGIDTDGSYYGLFDQLICEDFSTSNDHCFAYLCTYRAKCERCLEILKGSIETEVKKFFLPVIEALKKYPS